MNINRNNCESYFLDYYEKNLSPVGVAEVLFFLEENPDLKEVFESYEAIFLEQDKENFPDKESLKKRYNSGEIDAVLSSEINIGNCEQFFVASAEGILSEEQTKKLNSFLAQHPELKKEFELFQKCKLTSEEILFENKALLKKEAINAGNREEYFIRSIEKDLNISEQKQLASFLQKNPEYKKELELFKKTILVPEKISFEFKQELKKKERKPVFISLFSKRTAYYAAAASVLLILGLFFIFRNNDNDPTYVAHNPNHTTNPNKVENVNPSQENKASTETTEVIVPTQKNNAIEQNGQIAIRKKTSVKENLIVPAPSVKEEIIPQPVLLPVRQDGRAPSSSGENNAEENPIAKKQEEKKAEQIEEPTIAKNPEIKTDSIPLPAVEEQVMASNEQSKSNKEEDYQTIASIVNKTIRSVLGIKKSTECETSQKISLWDLAMVAKRGVQKRVGTKALDVNKVCDDTNGKIEYVFAAGNFEISKSASK